MTDAPNPEPARCSAGIAQWDLGTEQCHRARNHAGPHVSEDWQREWDDDGTIRPWCPSPRGAAILTPRGTP